MNHIIRLSLQIAPWLAAALFGLAFLNAHVDRGSLLLREENARAETRRLALEQRFLFDYLASQPISSPFLSGGDAVSSTTYILKEPLDGVFSLLASDCPRCPVNYSFLNALHDESGAAGFAVVGVSATDTFTELLRHVEQHGLAFPVIGEPSGGLLGVLPLYGTPLTLVFSRGCVVKMIAGEITEPDKEWIRVVAGRARTMAAATQAVELKDPPCHRRREFRETIESAATRR